MNSSNSFSETALEFDTVRLLLAYSAASPLGKRLARTLAPLNGLDEISTELNRLSAIIRSRQEGLSLDFGLFSGIGPETLELRDKKPVLEPKELYSIAAALREAAAYQQLIAAETERFPVLESLADRLDVEPWISEEILQSIDEEGNILDDASPQLAQLRKSLRKTQSGINSVLKQFFDPTEHPNYVQDDFITIRGDRLVIPIKIEHRSRHKGIVHGRSRGGDSLFFEPIEAVELNNTLAATEAEIKIEEAKVLARLTAGCFAHWKDIIEAFKAMAELDLLWAKARLAQLSSAVEPDLVEEGPLIISAARHPLLDERLKQLRLDSGLPEGGGVDRPVVPVDIKVGGEWKVLIITGPNAGGKTVTLKTAGLFALMAQSGMFVPAHSYSGPVFKTVMADIGDYQDIISHLSSFSSHLTWLKSVLEQIESPALILIDEISAATDPGEGSALAMATLEMLRDQGAFVLVTTHLEALKAFAHAQPGMENSCVEFDPKTLRPIFSLRYGLPGKSNALETAVETGLPTELIKKARNYLGEEGARISEIISRLQEELIEVRNEREQLGEESRALEKARRHYVEKLDRVEEKSQRELRVIRDEWTEFKRVQERQLKDTLARMKEAASVQQARDEIDAGKKKRDEEFSNLAVNRRRPLQPPSDDSPLAEGQLVELIGFAGQRGTVIRPWSKKGGMNVSVEVNGKRLSLPRAGVTPSGRSSRASDSTASVTVQSGERPLRMELNLIGKTVEEALDETDKFIDDALLNKLSSVRIIHGRGTGALRKAIENHLKSQPYIESWHPELPAAGGNAVTVVQLAK